MSHALITFLFTVCLSLSASAVPLKYRDREMRIPAPERRIFSHADISENEFVRLKRSEWKACHQEESQSVFSLLRDDVAPFVETSQIIRDLRNMETQGLLQGRADKQPWSGDYWPYDEGLLAARSFDPNFRYNYEWKERYDYVQGHPLSQFIESADPIKINTLSPAEKYDLIMGDSKGALTKSMWDQGKVYFDSQGKVEGWMGICHGWAPAAIMEPRPLKTIQVPARVQDLKVQFLPDELKGLISYSWATNSYRSVLLGERCNEKNPPLDDQGRLTHPECFDLNPATWHLAVVNRLGAQKKSFVMDATYDYQVWNQPVLEYSYSYFNPQTEKSATTLQDAIVPASEWSQDPYHAYRSPQARSIVGIEMKLAYVIESDVRNDPTDSEEFDSVVWVIYRYDLEIDEHGLIQGGEWHQESHPDFIWTPVANAKPLSPFDRMLTGDWTVANPIPEMWKKSGSLASPRGIIMNRVVQALLKKSQGPE